LTQLEVQKLNFQTLKIIENHEFKRSIEKSYC